MQEHDPPSLDRGTTAVRLLESGAPGSLPVLRVFFCAFAPSREIELIFL